MAATVPLISSGVAGPLGVLHLPRFWQKVVLKATGNLHDEYPECGAGFDQMCLNALGLDKDETLAYLHDNVPSYPEFEKWVLEKKGGSLDQAAVGEFNSAARGYNHDDDTRKGILDAAGIEDDGSVLDAVHLNQLEDWTEFHASLK
ncbi:DUF5069 domain-containing protein [bacterium]|jgi:hypothetical protein|nr:DUF5069 domain-containing protein [bacterium]HCK09898.1 DUF5069 domain-containing protein [Candidatus Latescibacterota bacterium]